MGKDKRYYVKDGIKCSKRDLKENLRNTKYSLLDLVAGYWDLLKLKLRRKSK